MWREVATVLIFIVVMHIVVNTLFVGVEQAVIDINATGDYDTSYMDGNQAMLDMAGALFDAAIISVMGIMMWAVYRWIRKERFIGRRGGGRF